MILGMVITGTEVEHDDLNWKKKNLLDSSTWSMFNKTLNLGTEFFFAFKQLSFFDMF